MREISFSKFDAHGNDFIIIDNRNSKIGDDNKASFVEKIARRRFGVGADGVIFLEQTEVKQNVMRYFNSDGSEAEMCGNGLRALGYYIYLTEGKTLSNVVTSAGILPVKVDPQSGIVSIQMPEYQVEELTFQLQDIPFQLNFVKVGVPHLVIFVDSVEDVDMERWGKRLRYHTRFAPQGTNVDWVEISDKHTIKIRTYERGVEKETLACGTGVTSAVLTAEKFGKVTLPVVAYVKYPAQLTVRREQSKIYLEGKVRMVYRGIYYEELKAKNE